MVRLKVGMGKKNTYNVGKGFYNGMIFYGGGKGGGVGIFKPETIFGGEEGWGCQTWSALLKWNSMEKILKILFMICIV